MKGVRFYCSVALLAIFGLGQPVAAETNFRGDGNALLRACHQTVAIMDKSEAPIRLDADYFAGAGFGSGYCIGLVRGILNFRVQIFSELERVGLTPVCIPEQAIPVGFGVRVVLKYLNDHPENLHLDDAFLVVAALANAFPCINIKQ